MSVQSQQALITGRSKGTTGFAIVQGLLKAGFKVDFVCIAANPIRTGTLSNFLSRTHVS